MNTTDITNMTDAQIDTLLFGRTGQLQCCNCGTWEVPPHKSMLTDPALKGSYLGECCEEQKPGADGSEDGDFACSPDHN